MHDLRDLKNSPSGSTEATWGVSELPVDHVILNYIPIDGGPLQESLFPVAVPHSVFIGMTFGSREFFAGAISDALGVPVDPARIKFWKVLITISRYGH